MSTIADLLIKVRADTDSAEKDLDSVGKRGSSSLGKLAKAGVLAAGAGGIAAVGFAVKDVVGDMIDGQKATAQTNAVLKSTRGIAHVSTAEIQDLATAIQMKSGMDDAAVQSGENMLLTFTNIRNEAGKGNDIFTQTTSIMADMSAALGQDTASSAMQLGKALNDPIKGMSALQRVGVAFTDGQKKQVKAMVESGNTIGAQKLILHELNKEFGGSAEAMGKTLPGQIQILKAKFEVFTEDLIARVTPAVQQAVSWLRDHWPEIQAAFQTAWANIKPVLTSLIALAVQVVDTIRTHWGTIGPIVMGVAKVIGDVCKNIATALRLVTALLRGDWGEAWKQAKALVVGILTQLKNEALVILNAFKALAGAAATGIKNAIVAGVTGVAGRVWNLIKDIGSTITSNLGEVAGWGASIGSRLIHGILSGLAGLGSKILNMVRSAANSVINQINSALEFSFGVHVAGHGVTVHVNPPDIPQLAVGTNMVHEDGLAYLHRGEAVVPANVAGGGFGGGRGGITVEGDLVIREEMDVERVAARLGRRLAVVSP